MALGCASQISISNATARALAASYNSASTPRSNLKELSL